MPPVINVGKCVSCGNCAEICAQDVFYGSKKKQVPVITYPDFCVHCSCCVNECPVDGAIKIRIPLPLMLLYSKPGFPISTRSKSTSSRFSLDTDDMPSSSDCQS